MSDAQPTAIPDQRGWLRRLVAACLHYRSLVGLAFGGSLVGMTITALVPLVQRRIVDNVIVAHKESLWPLAAILVVAALVSYGTTFVRRYFGGRLALDVQHDLRNGIFGSLSRLDGARQDELQTGQIIGRATSDITMVQGLLSIMPDHDRQHAAVRRLADHHGHAVAAAHARRARGRPGAAVGLDAGSQAAVPRDLGRAAAERGRRRGSSTTRSPAYASSRASARRTQELTKLETVAKRLFASRVRAARLTARYNPSLQVIPALGQVGVLALGGYLAVKGNISLGTFLAFSTYLAQLVGPVRMLSSLITIGQQARASVIRVFEVIDSRPIVTEKPDAVDLPDRP